MQGSSFDLDVEGAHDDRQEFALGEQAEVWAKSIAAKIVDLQAELVGVEHVVSPLLERIDSLKNKIEKSKEQLAKLMDSANVDKIKDPRFVIKRSRTLFVHVAEGAALPDEYLRKTIKIAPDLLAIKRDIERGVVVDGCKIEEKSYVTIK